MIGAPVTALVVWALAVRVTVGAAAAAVLVLLHLVVGTMLVVGLAA